MAIKHGQKLESNAFIPRGSWYPFSCVHCTGLFLHPSFILDVKIAQYNVHKRQDTMILLSAHKDTAKYDVLAIQEPARNPTMYATSLRSDLYARPIDTLEHAFLSTKNCL
jgi:hypothetical protein